jgi:hypothetical protein
MPFESATVVFFRADQLRRRGLMLPGQIAKEAPEISAPALLVYGKCGFRFGDEVSGSGIQAEGDAAGQKRGSRYELAAGGGFLSGDYHGSSFYSVCSTKRYARVEFQGESQAWTSRHIHRASSLLPPAERRR